MKILRNRKIFNFLLLFIPILEGLFVITTLLSTQSDPKNVIFLGFSASRLVLISFSLLLTALFTFSLINSKLNNKIVDWLYSSSKLQTRIKQYGLIILMLLYLTLYISEDYFGIFAASFVRLRPLIIWLELIFLQLFLSLKYISRENIFINKNSKLVSVVITKLDRFLEVNFFVPKMLIPLGVLLLYSGSYAYIFSRFLVETVNGFFATRLFYITLIFTLGISIIFLVRYISRSHAKLSFDQSAEKITYSNLLLILLPLTPVVQYILNNQDILSPIESLAILVLFAIIAVLYIIFVPLIFRNVSSTHLLMIIGLTFIFTINTMALLSQQFSWFQKGNFLIQLIFFYLVFLLSWLLFNLKDKKVFRLIIVMFFLINSFTQLLSFNKNAEKPSNTLQKNNLESLVVDRSPVDKPNIYLLVYDAYVVNETMLAYGIDNSAQEAFLIDQGFKLYPSTYSVGAASIETMSRVLNASTDFYGDSRRAVSGDGIVQNLLKNLGYTTYGIFPYSYYFLGIGSSYDYSFPKESTAIKQVVSGILIGEFRFDL